MRSPVGREILCLWPCHRALSQGNRWKGSHAMLVLRKAIVKRQNKSLKFRLGNYIIHLLAVTITVTSRRRFIFLSLGNLEYIWHVHESCAILSWWCLFKWLRQMNLILRVCGMAYKTCHGKNLTFKPHEQLSGFSPGNKATKRLNFAN